MIGYMGEAFLILAGISCLSTFFVAERQLSGQKLSLLIFLCLSAAFTVFLYAHVFDHFEIANVFLHSHTHKPLPYKIAGTWASHEGSLLLWCLLLALYQFIFAHMALPKDIKNISLVFLSLLQLSFLIFLIIASNPFEQLMEIPQQGQDLNPLLQDISLVIHPPHLYLGTLGFALPFVLSLSMLLHKDTSPLLFKKLQYLTLLALGFLSIGIVLGSLWAYYELGWGGWWFFDPVENLALIPWLLGLINIHLAVLVIKQGTHQRLYLLLSLMTFLSCLLSLALIRSGVLNSVHSFGMDEKRGALLFMLFGFWATAAGFVYRRGQKSLSTAHLGLWHRTFFMNMAMLCVLLSCLSLSIGTFFPLVTDLLGQHFTLSNDFYHETFLTLWFPLLVLLPTATHLSWKNKSAVLKKIWLQFFVISSLSFLMIVTFFTMTLLLCVWLSLAIAAFITSIRLLLTFQKLNNFGQNIAHTGFTVAIIGILLSSFLSHEKTILMAVGDQISLGGEMLIFKESKEVDGPNYTAIQGFFEVKTTFGTKQVIAEERLYKAQKSRHLETALFQIGPLSQALIMIAHTENQASAKEGTTQSHFTVKLIEKPFINLMWCGFLLIIAGIFIVAVTRFRRG